MMKNDRYYSVILLYKNAAGLEDVYKLRLTLYKQVHNFSLDVNNPLMKIPIAINILTKIWNFPNWI